MIHELEIQSDGKLLLISRYDNNNKCIISSLCHLLPSEERLIKTVMEMHESHVQVIKNKTEDDSNK